MEEAVSSLIALSRVHSLGGATRAPIKLIRALDACYVRAKVSEGWTVMAFRELLHGLMSVGVFH